MKRLAICGEFNNLKIDETGEFWLSSEPDRRMEGVVKSLEDGSYQLELKGLSTFSEGIARQFYDRSLRFGGWLSNGRPITVDRCLSIQDRFVAGQKAQLRVTAELLLLGCHYEFLEEMKFKAAEFHAGGLEVFLGHGEIETSFDSDNSRIDVSYKIPPDREILLDDGTILSFRSEVAPLAIGNLARAEVFKRTWVKIENVSELTFDDVMIKIAHFLRLAGLATDQICKPTNIRLFTSELVGQEGELVPLTVCHGKLVDPDQQWKYISKVSHLFCLSDLKHFGRDVLTSWFDNQNVAEAAYRIYFSYKASRDVGFDTELLTLIQAAEVFCVDFEVVGQQFDELEFAEFERKILSLTPEHFENWMRQRLKYGNQPSLRSRLKELLKPLSSFGISRKVQKDMAGLLVDVRNDLIHRGKLPATKQLSTLAYSRDLLEIAMDMNFLLTAGVSNQRVTELIGSSISRFNTISTFKGMSR